MPSHVQQIDIGLHEADNYKEVAAGTRRIIVILPHSFTMVHVEILPDSQGLHAERVKIMTNISSPAGVGPLKGGRLLIGLTTQTLSYCTASRT